MIPVSWMNDTMLLSAPIAMCGSSRLALIPLANFARHYRAADCLHQRHESVLFKLKMQQINGVAY